MTLLVERPGTTKARLWRAPPRTEPCPATTPLEQEGAPTFVPFAASLRHHVPDHRDLVCDP